MTHYISTLARVQAHTADSTPINLAEAEAMLFTDKKNHGNLTTPYLPGPKMKMTKPVFKRENRLSELVTEE